MALAEITKNKILLTVPVQEVTPGIKTELEEVLNNYPIEVIPKKMMSIEQMRLIYVLFHQWAEEEAGGDYLYIKDVLIGEFCSKYEIPGFSTSPYKANTLDMETATQFIQFIIELGIQENRVLYIRDKNQNYKHIRTIVPDIQKYMIACLRNRVCAICGKRHDEYNTVELHHWKSVASAVGTYENDDGLSTPFISLCTEHHQEFHGVGVESFKNKYHIEGVYLNEKLVIELKEIYTNHFKAFKG